MPATSFSLACAVLFAHIAGSSFVLEDVYGVSPQGFSLVFAVNSVGLIGMSQLGGRLVEQVGADALLRYALVGVAAGSVGAFVVTVTNAGLAALLISLFVMVSFDGLVFPNATAVSLEGQEGALGSASALLGMGQFGVGALIAPLVGVAGSHDALPMGVLIGVCGLAALAVNLVFSTSARDRTTIPDRMGSPGPTDAELGESGQPGLEPPPADAGFPSEAQHPARSR